MQITKSAKSQDIPKWQVSFERIFSKGSTQGFEYKDQAKQILLTRAHRTMMNVVLLDLFHYHIF